eukprot:6471691-Amphidinium_carterae.2
MRDTALTQSPPSAANPSTAEAAEVNGESPNASGAEQIDNFDPSPVGSVTLNASDTLDATPGWGAPRGMNDPAPTRARTRRSHDVRTVETGTCQVIPPSINKIHLKWLDGSKVELHCSQLRNGSYQWKVSSGIHRYAKTGQTSRGVVLRRWHDDYVNLLDPSSAEDLLMTIRLKEGETVTSPPEPVEEQLDDSRPEDTIELTDAPLWRLPSLEEIEHFPSFEVLQEHMVASQKLLPKSLTHTLANTVNWLLTTAEDTHQPAEIRAWCLRIFLLAPRILWPEVKLKPNARPHVIKQRLALASNVSTRNPSGAHNPGTITPQAAKSLVSSAREGRIGPAWKQLWSHGIAPNTAETAEAVQRKWAPAPTTTLPSITPLPPTEIAEAVSSQKQWLLATRKLKKGTAADAAGWFYRSVWCLGSLSSDLRTSQAAGKTANAWHSERRRVAMHGSHPYSCFEQERLRRNQAYIDPVDLAQVTLIDARVISPG